MMWGEKMREGGKRMSERRGCRWGRGEGEGGEKVNERGSEREGG